MPHDIRGNPYWRQRPQIDAASFLSSQAAVRDLFPDDTTMLVTKQAPSDQGGDGEGSSPSGEGGAEGGGEGGQAESGGGGGVPLVELKSFTTQAFFTCWRAVHLGLLQVSWRFCFSRTLSVDCFLFVLFRRPVWQERQITQITHFKQLGGFCGRSAEAEVSSIAANLVMSAGRFFC